MMKRFLLLVLLFTWIPVSAEEAPVVEYTGFVSGAGGTWAVVETETSAYLVRTGLKLGDYSVSLLDPRRVVLRSPTGTEFPLLLGGPELNAPASAKLRLRLDGASMAQVTKAIARVCGVAVYQDSTLESPVKYVGPADGMADALARAFPSGGPAVASVPLAQTEFWIVGRPTLVGAVSASLRVSRHGGKLVTFDFVDAQFAYVMQILAQELGVNLKLEEELSSGVTIFTPEGGLPAEDLVAAIAAAEGWSYRLDTTTLLVGGAEWLRGQEK